MNRPVKDVAHSVRQRLQNVARQANRLFQEVLAHDANREVIPRL